jgi:hypothetical protein
VIGRLALALSAVLLAPRALAGQALTGSAALGGGWVRTESQAGSTQDLLSGIVVGGEGRLRLGRVSLDLAYREGSIATEDGADTRDYADGQLLLLVRAVSGVRLGVGPHARAYITTSGTQRWLFWTLRIRGEGTLIVPGIAGYAEVWRSLSARVNVSEPFERSTGGEVGMTVRFAPSRFWARLGYTIERAWLGNGTRVETVESLAVVLGFGAR